MPGHGGRPDGIPVRILLQEISESISRHGYFPQSQDMVALRECVLGE